MARQIAKQNKKREGGDEKEEERKADAIDLEDGGREKINLDVAGGVSASENGEKKRKEMVDSGVDEMFSNMGVETGKLKEKMAKL